MRIVVIGAGALGGSYGGRLALAAEDVTLIDSRSEHEAHALNLPVPFNAALTALVKGRETARIIVATEPARDYDATEQSIGPRSGP